MNKNIDYYLGLPYTIEIIPESNAGWYVGIKELPGCMTDVDTPEEGLIEIRQLQREWLEIALEDGLAIPEPRPEEEYSGNFRLRVPKSVHRKLVEAAAEDDVSLNTYCATALAQSIGLGQKEKDKVSKTTSSWEKTASRLVTALDLKYDGGKTLEDAISDWIQCELKVISRGIDSDDLIGALGNLRSMEKDLSRYGKESPLLQTISQILMLLGQTLREQLVIDRKLDVQVGDPGCVADEVNRTIMDNPKHYENE